MPDSYVQAETTVGTREDAERLAGDLVGRRLAACAQIVGPIRSVYRWEGEVRDEEEHLVRFKTRAARAEPLKEALAAAPPYDVPEVLIFAVADGARSYLDWVSAETRPGPP